MMPFITVNCGAQSDTLHESELFGLRAGVFINARSDKLEWFSPAND
jgi:transcriptional regulator with AAA-type ATPase domain